MQHLEMSILDPEKLVKLNDLKEVSNPIFFIRNGVPTDDGLLSNSVFGITMTERSQIFAYIDLYDWFINPLIYKIYCSMDKKIRQIVHETNKFIINSSGELIEDNDNGKTGIKFLKDNIDKIKIKPTDSNKRDINIKFINDNKHLMFMKKMIVIPAYYRDVNTDGGKIGVGDINKLYDSLLIAVRALKETQDYGLSMSGTTKGRIQEILLQIYQWFTKEPNLSKKKGTIRRAGMSKTTDYASRLVLSAPELKVERVNDLEVDLDHCALPLASACVNLFPYMIFWIRRFFENEFSGVGTYPYRNKKGELKFVHVKDPLIEFSDERIKHELDRFIKGYSNRFIPIKVPNEEGINIYMHFKGKNLSAENATKDQITATPLLGRKLTWCDIFYMAAVEMSKDKVALITRYPMDSYFNQFASLINISSTKETEPMYVDNTFYKRYPKIRNEDIGKDTSNKFIDTLRICNLMLPQLTGDYDGV